MKQCEKCGNQIAEGAAFCTNCGTAVGGAMQPQANTANTGAFIPMTSANQATVQTTPTSDASPTHQPTNSEISSQAPSSETSKKKLDGKMIAMIAVSVICLAVGITGAVLALSGNNGSTSNGEVATNNPTNNGGSTVDVTSSGTKVSYSGYEFVIPDGYEYELSTEDGSESLLVSNRPDDYLASISYNNDVAFASLKSNIDAASAMLTEQFGNKVVGSIKTIGDKEYIYFDLGEIEGVNAMYVLSEADLYYFETFIMTNAGVSGTEYLDNVVNVLSTAQKKKSMPRSLNSNSATPIETPSFKDLLENS